MFRPKIEPLGLNSTNYVKLLKMPELIKALPLGEEHVVYYNGLVDYILPKLKVILLP